MKRTIVVMLLAAVGLALGACHFNKSIKGSGVSKSETRELKPFNAIDTTGAYEINVTCQKPAGFEIEADDNILPLIKTEVHDGVLSVSNQESYNSSRPVTLRITLPKLLSISSHGAGKINLADADSDDLKIESTGAATIDAAGKAKSLTISSTGAGNIQAGELRAEKAKISMTGAGNVDVYASEQLDVSVSGVGSVSYGGNPKTVNKNVSGFGSVKKKGE